MWIQIEKEQRAQAPRLSRQPVWFVALFCTLLLMCSLPAAAQEATVPAFAGGLVFDAAQSTIYAMEPNQLSARAADSGNVLWARADLAEPLALHQGRLLVLGNREKYREPVAYWLDPTSGSTLGEFTLDLPDEVSFLISERPGERFQAEAFVQGDDLFLAWNYVKRQLIGAPAVAGINRAAKMPRVSSAGQREAETSSSIVDTTLVSANGVFRIGPGQAAAVDRAETGVADFNRWAKLYGADRSSAAEGNQYRSGADGHILASRLIEDGDRWLSHQWTILNDQGEQLGQFRLPVAFAPFSVGEKSFAYRSQPYVRFNAGEVSEARDLSLVVLDLESGRELWETALLDTTWREGMPP